jgi:hypothetical protein
MKQILLTLLLGVTCYSTKAQTQLKNIHGTYDFDRVCTMDKDNATKVWGKDTLTSSIDFYIDQYGFGKMFIFIQNDKIEFIINRCEETSKEGMTFSLIGMTDKGSVNLQAFIVKKNGEARMFGFQTEPNSHWETLLNSKL